MENLALIAIDSNTLDPNSSLTWVLFSAFVLACLVMLFLVWCFHYSWWYDWREKKRAEASGETIKSFDEKFLDAFGEALDEETDVEVTPIILDSEGLVFECDGLQTIETEDQLREFWREKSGVESADPNDPAVQRYYRAEEKMVEELRRSKELIAELKGLCARMSFLPPKGWL